MSERRASGEILVADPGAFFRQHRTAIAEALMRVTDSGRYILGDEVRAFEAEFALYCATPHAVGVASGTDAVALALRALGVGAGDRVATVSHTAVATVAAIESIGARPLLIDISPEDYTLSPGALDEALAARGPVAAVVVVHLYGQPADMSGILSVARRHGAMVVEDCAQAHGARLAGVPVGGLCDAGAFSFYPSKNLGALGDGGCVTLTDAAVAARLRSLREYGWEQRYVSVRAGVNSRLDELQAAVLRYRLPLLDAGNRRRDEIAAAYDRGLAGSGLRPPARRRDVTHAFHQYVIRHPDRDALRARLAAEGIGTNVHYPVPVHRQPAYAGRLEVAPAGLPETEAAAREVLSLPMYPELDDASVERVIDAVRRLA